MALGKIISVKNIGRFLNAVASGDVTFRHNTLVFAPNGRGKTTLCAILRSLKHGEPAYITGRRSLGSPDQPEVRFLLDNNRVNFNNGAWSETLPELAIFDATYVTENVHSGEAVDTEQRRNLYRVIIGSDGVALARRLDGLDAQIRHKNLEIREARAIVQRHIPQVIGFDEFIELPEDAGIDGKIAAKEQEAEAVGRADQIQQRPPLQRVVLPKMPGEFTDLLAKTLEGVAADAERQVSEHIRAHEMAERGEPWLSEGLRYINDERCPFCAQNLTGVDLIDAYTAFFSEAYHRFRDEIAGVANDLESDFGDREIATIERVLHQNGAGVEYWQQYCTFDAPVIGADVYIAAAITSLRQVGLALLHRKQAAPLEALRPDEAFTQASETFGRMQAAVTAYNNAIDAANAVINAKKQETDAANVQVVQASLVRLRAVKARHTEEVHQACLAYQNLVAEKVDLDRKKTETRRRLDRHTAGVIEHYGQSINRNLDSFHADFRISTPTHSYQGGTASSSYRILINEVPVDLGNPGTPLDRPSFKNTLSAGDRSTLALALFFAEIERDPQRANRIVILDDPFNSQDAFRQSQTVQQIRRLGAACAQVVVLSHNQNFLKMLWDRLPPAERKTIQLGRVGEENTTISEWDIEEAVKWRYRADVEALQRFYSDNEGNPRDVIQKIRPVLEGYCRNLYPSQFTDQDRLGDIIAKIRAAAEDHPLHEILDHLDDLNAYTSRYHHGENPNAATEPIDDGELRKSVKRTLTLVGCF